MTDNLNSDDVMYLRQMLMSPGYKVLLRVMDEEVERLRVMAAQIGESNPLDVDLGQAFLVAKVAREFRKAMNTRVMTVVNAAREEQNDSIPMELVERRTPVLSRDEILGMLEPAPPQAENHPLPQLISKYRR